MSFIQWTKTKRKWIQWRVWMLIILIKMYQEMNLRMIILHEHPLSIVDHIGFKKYSTSLQPLFRMVSRNIIKKDILSIYEKEREKSKHEIDKNQGRISITIDMWTSQNKKRGFMVVTAHFIDGLWRLQSRVMRYFFLKYIFIFMFQLNSFQMFYELISFLVLIMGKSHIARYHLLYYLLYYFRNSCAISTYERSAF